MEEQLKQYRAVRRRQALLDTAKEQYEKSKAKLINLIVPKAILEDNMDKQEEHALLMENEALPPLGKRPIQPIEELDDIDVESEMSQLESLEDKDLPPCTPCLYRWILYFIVWGAVWGIFLYLQFGAVYFVVSILIGIYLNTRTGPKRKGEVSAYSVFNRHCASIEGTINPEQFEREIRYGMGTTRSF